MGRRTRVGGRPLRMRDRRRVSLCSARAATSLGRSVGTFAALRTGSGEAVQSLPLSSSSLSSSMKRARNLIGVTCVPLRGDREPRLYLLECVARRSSRLERRGARARVGIEETLAVVAIRCTRAPFPGRLRAVEVNRGRARGCWRTLKQRVPKPRDPRDADRLPLFFFTAFGGGSRTSAMFGFDFKQGYTEFQFVFVRSSRRRSVAFFTGFGIAARIRERLGRRVLSPRRTAPGRDRLRDSRR